jgi:cell division protein FtsL
MARLSSSVIERTVTLVLLGLVVVSALAVVTNIDDRRQVFAARQAQLVASDKADGHWRQLLLEQAAQSTQVEVDKVAHHRLKMRQPAPGSIILVSGQ